MTTCLVTGGAGFIGSHLVDTLVARGFAVRVLDDFSTGTLTNLAFTRNNIELFFGDLTNAGFLRQVMKGVDFVFHHASFPVWESGLGDPDGPQENVVSATINVLRAAREARVRRLIFASSVEVYGRALSYPLSESSSFRPVSAAGLTKLAEEEQCIAYTRLYGLETVCLRYFNVFGPRQLASSPYAAIIPQILKPMLLGRRPILHGDGDDPQEFIFVADVVYANLLATEATRVAGRVYNIARGVPTTARELVNVVNGLLSTRLQPVLSAPRPKGELHNLANITRAQGELGFCTSTDLETGLQQCINYYGRWRAELVGATSR
jgi:UDP-glucose 4-epimerase